MYRKIIYGSILRRDPAQGRKPVEKAWDDTFFPRVTTSTNWKHWCTVLDERLCQDCEDHRGKIYRMEEIPNPGPPLHPRCRCAILPMETIAPGEASKEGKNGAEHWQFYSGRLPDYYITKKELISLGWERGEPPKRYVPGKMVFGGVYENRNGHLPMAAGRIWYEADLNYYEGRRNGHRLLFSNDGLFFVTYDHYKTFYELMGEG